MRTRRIFLIALALLLCLGVFASCKDGNKDGDESEIYYTVTFNSNGGEEISPKLVKKGATVDEPTNPTRDGYVFDGWYHGTRRWAFSFSVTEDMTLDARWVTADSVFEHAPNEDGETTVITGIRSQAEEIRLPTYLGGYKVTTIGEAAFSHLSVETVYKVVIPDGVSIVEERAFEGSADVEIVIEGEISYVGEKAFFGCNGLKSIKLGGGIENISAEAFVGAGLEVIELPDSVKIVDENAFSECSSLRRVIMHDNVEAINDMAFKDTAVAAVFFYGTDENVIALLEERVFAHNEAIVGENTKHYLYSETEPAADAETELDGFWYFHENGQTRIWQLS